MSPESNPKLQKLERILLAFSIHSPGIGHCQSFNAIAGFWMLVTIVHDYFPPDMFNETAHESSLEQTVLMMLIYEKMPGLWSKISSKRCFWDCEQKGNLPSITFVTSHWLSNMYLNILPVETVLRVWDCFLV
jgi:hypothetical protein